MIDETSITRAHRLTCINTTLPYGPTTPAKPFRVILHQQCLCLAILILLREITPQRCTSPVPHKSGCREPHAEASLLQAPAEIDIVTSDQITFTKTTNRLQYLFSNRKVTSRQMLGLIIIEQNMRRCSLRRGHHHLIDNTGTTIM